jgi:uncharacterized protein YgiM (DUF1202 family)
MIPQAERGHMKLLATTATLLGGLIVMAPSTASALTPYECEQQAEQYAEAQFPTGGGAARGATGGAIFGGIFSGLTGGKPGRGMLLGGAGGAVVGSALWLERKQQAHDDYLAQCLQTAVSQPPAALPPTPFKSTISASALNVRTGPGVEYAIVTKITPGRVFDVLSCASGWCWIDIDGVNGYVSADYLYPLYEG